MTRELLKDVLLLLNEVCIENALECLNEAQRLYNESFRKYNIDNAELDLQSVKNMIARIETELLKPDDPDSWPCKMVAADWKEKTAVMEFENSDFKAFAGNYYLSMSPPQLSGNTGQVPEPVPVAWMCPNDPDIATAFSWKNQHKCSLKTCFQKPMPVFTSPPPRKPLTNDEIIDVCMTKLGWSVVEDLAFKFVRAIEKAHGIE
jgi:hypothetical protein